MKEAIRRVPVPLAGVMLGFAAFGNFLKNFSGSLWVFMEGVAGLLLILLLLRVLMDPEGFAGNCEACGCRGFGYIFHGADVSCGKCEDRERTDRDRLLVGGPSAPYGSDHLFHSCLCQTF